MHLDFLASNQIHFPSWRYHLYNYFYTRKIACNKLFFPTYDKHSVSCIWTKLGAGSVMNMITSFKLIVFHSTSAFSQAQADSATPSRSLVIPIFPKEWRWKKLLGGSHKILSPHVTPQVQPIRLIFFFAILKTVTNNTTTNNGQCSLRASMCCCCPFFTINEQVKKAVDFVLQNPNASIPESRVTKTVSHFLFYRMLQE